MFPAGYLSGIVRATIAGGVGIIVGGFVGAIIFGTLMALLSALITSAVDVPADGPRSEVNTILASISGLGGALWGMGIGGAAGFLVGVFMVILQPLREALDASVYFPDGKSK